LTLFRSLHAEALQAIAGKGLAQGPYMAAKAGFEPTTVGYKGRFKPETKEFLEDESSRTIEFL